MTAHRLPPWLVRNFAAAVYFAWALVMLWLLVTGNYTSFLLAKFWPLVAVAIPLLLVLGNCAVASAKASVHGESGFALVLQGAVLLVPLVYIATVSGTTLGSQALAARSLNPAAVLAPLRERAARSDRGPQADASGALTILELMAHQEQLTGEEVVTTGMVFRSPTARDGEVFLFRFVVVCCAADAQPLGLYVALPEGMPDRLENDDWVRVRGRIASRSAAGATEPVFRAESVEKIPPPPIQEHYLSAGM